LFVMDDTPSTPTDYTLIGNKMIIRGFQNGSIGSNGNGDGILICGHSVEDFFDFNGASRFDPTADTCDGAGPIDGISINNVWLALLGADGVQLDSDGAANLTFDTLKIFAIGSETDGNGIEIEAGGTSIVTMTVMNSSIHAVDDAIEVNGEKCHIDINQNFDIVGLESAIEIDCEGGSRIRIEDNGDLVGKESDGINFNSTGDADGVEIRIKRNGDIIGGDDDSAIELEADLSMEVEIIDNGHIEGGGDGIKITADTGAEITIENNSPAGTIRGASGHGIDLNTLGDGSDVRIVNNGDIIGADDDEAIEVTATDSLELLIDRNRDIIFDLPTLDGCNRLGAVKTGAILLAKRELSEDDADTLPVGERLNKVQSVPLMAVQNVGKGRVLSLAMDTTWRWEMLRDKDSDDQFRRFWGRVIRSMAPDPRISPRLPQILNYQSHVTVGRQMKMATRLVDKFFQPVRTANIEVAVTSPSGRVTLIYPHDGRQAPGLYEYEFPVDESGEWTVITRYNDEEAVKRFDAGESPDEFSDPRAKPELMQQLAQATGGRVISADQPATKLIDELKLRPRSASETAAVPVWNLHVTMVLLILLVGIDCFVRKKRGMV
ncbi:MAG: hypothetical protein IH987_15955, partial [Planctomycetes bacterium]|nr:hypothetical protein [Planctomycetota bacterium]